jgi:hypothetical protein
MSSAWARCLPSEAAAGRPASRGQCWRCLRRSRRLSYLILSAVAAMRLTTSGGALSGWSQKNATVLGYTPIRRAALDACSARHRGELGQVLTDLHSMSRSFQYRPGEASRTAALPSAVGQSSQANVATLLPRMRREIPHTVVFRQQLEVPILGRSASGSVFTRCRSAFPVRHVELR